MRITNQTSDSAVLVELGRRIEERRLERNTAQEQLAAEAGVSRSTVQQIEQGSSITLTNFLRIARALGLLEELDRLLPETLPSPIERLKTGGRRRRRASLPRSTPPGRSSGGSWPWPTGGTT